MHCESNTGYAIEKLEVVFFNAAIQAGFAKEDIVFAYPSVSLGKPHWMEETGGNFVEFNCQDYSLDDTARLRRVLATHKISSAFCFDLQPSNACQQKGRSIGMSSLNTPILKSSLVTSKSITKSFSYYPE